MSSTIDNRQLEALRRHGFGVAYRMLGSVGSIGRPSCRPAATKRGLL